ncbi:MAG: hypothetical protein HQK54_07295, partial [Oligoflexales bacterium]|nr:hypothetical protein [Oligoflexales bacterium]
TLGRFLFEHEILNDRERDRDFFVGARALSRLIEQKKEKRTMKVPKVIERIKNYLEERHARWTLRVDRLGSNFQPQRWPSVRAKPFIKGMEEILDLDRQKGDDSSGRALVELSKNVTSYREWIEELEKKEDEYRKNMDKARQQGIADARKTLRELQKRQDQISKRLDKAEIQDKKKLSDEWPSNRMEQNSNITEATHLLDKIIAFSPMAGKRIEFAVQSMKQTVENGNAGNFLTAESSSDMAGRMLRQADNEASKSQKESAGRRERRRVSGDNYFGNRLIGGDIEIRHEYRVDKRYREDILEDVREHRKRYDSRDDSILEEYLRKIVR